MANGPYKVSEKLPDSDRTVLAICKDGEYRTAKYDATERMWRNSDTPWQMHGNEEPVYWWETLCGTCDDTGSIDSGGVTPWGESIEISCPDCHGRKIVAAGGM